MQERFPLSLRAVLCGCWTGLRLDAYGEIDAESVVPQARRCGYHPSLLSKEHSHLVLSTTAFADRDAPVATAKVAPSSHDPLEALGLSVTLGHVPQRASRRGHFIDSPVNPSEHGTVRTEKEAQE
jgi:hypothetical protein